LNQQLEKQLQGTEANNASLTSQLNEFKDKLSLSSSQLNEARNQLSEVQKNYKLLSGDHEALSNASLEQCDELILTLTHSQEKLQQRRVSDEPTIFAYHI
jgi:chromosome segregation ATPase